MLYVQEKVVKLGGIYLEGQVTSVEVQEAGSVYVAQDEKGRYKKSQPVGYENAKVMIDILLEDTKTAINTIAEVNSSWGIKNPFFFQKKVFYWGTKEEQKEIYVLEEGETILSLNKYGDLWEAETIAIPWIHHSQEVEVQHSKYSGIVTVEKTIVRSDDTGAVHMYIYFAGGEKDV